MDRINPLDLPPVARTLLIPLAARARDNARPDPLVRDPRAAELLGHFGDGLAGMETTGDFDDALIALRTRQFDRYARAFLEANPEGLLVDIGCGLDTRFDRLDNGRMAWIGLDLPEVIALRRRILPDTVRSHTIAGSMLDFAWMDTVAEMRRPTLFLAAAVLPYFPEADVKRVITALSMRFPGAGLVFDGYSAFLVWAHKKFSRHKETSAQIQWTVKDPRGIEPWGLRLVDTWGYFDRYEPRLGPGNLLRYIPLLANVAYVLHYRLEPGNIR